MKHFALFAFALMLASPAFAPDAEARHKRAIDHRNAASTYACIQNESGWHAQIQLHYKRENSQRWEQSPWSYTAIPKKRVCIKLNRAGEWREYHVYAKLWGIPGAKPFFCYRATRGVADSENRDYPLYSIGTFHSSYNWRKVQVSTWCGKTPRFSRGCHACRIRDW